jgi:membrane-associated phospholipid phosphatase
MLSPSNTRKTSNTMNPRQRNITQLTFIGLKTKAVKHSRKQVSTNVQSLAQSAMWLSRVFHPFIVSVVTLWLVQLLSGYGWPVSTLWTLLSFAIVILPALVFILVRVRSGRYQDIDVSIRNDRYVLYFLSGSCLVLMIILLIVFQAPAIAQKTLQAGFLSILVGSIFNRFVNKLSLHVLTVAGCAVVLFLVSPIAGVALAFISILVAWSRVYLQRHTIPEVIWGWVVGILCTIFWLLVSRQFYPTP